MSWPNNILKTEEETERILRRIAADSLMPSNKAAIVPLPPLPPFIAQREIDLQRKVDALEKEIARRDQEAAKKEDSTYTRVGEEKVAMLAPIAVICPECKNTYEVLTMADLVRIRFRHPLQEMCSRSKTEFFRPIAQFTQFV